MPKSKRSKMVSLTKVGKKTKGQKTNLVKEVQENLEKWQHCWVFDVSAMRNNHLQTVRKLWKDTARIFLGKGAVMAKALGSTPEDEHRKGISKLAQQIKGQVGLFFTDSPPQEVIDWFDDFKQPEFARSGNVATRSVVLPEGPVMRKYSDPPEPFPHNEDPQLRKLGLTTYLVKGVPSLQVPHKVCSEGKVLTAEQAQLLKLIGERMAVFRLGLFARWDAATGEVIQMDERRVANGEADGDEEDDKEMAT